MDEEPKNKVQNKMLKTYSEDIVKAVKSGKTGLLQKIVRDKEMHDIEEKNISPYSKRNKFFLFVSLFLLFSALAVILYGVVAKYNKTVPVAPQFTPLIFNDETSVTDISNLKKEEVVIDILDKKNTSTVKIGGLEGFYFTKDNQAVNFYDFAEFFKFNLPENYINNISSAFLFGLVNVEIEKINEEDNDTSSKDTLTIPEPVLVEGETVSLDSSAFFKTGTAIFVDKDAQDKAKENIATFLAGVDFATFKIKVTGTYSVERPSEKNDDIAESRRGVGLDILNEVLNAKYSKEEISKVTIESGTKGVSIYDTHTKEEVSAMTKEEVDKLIDTTQGIQYLAQAKTKPTFVEPITQMTNAQEAEPTDTLSSGEAKEENIYDPLRNPVAKPSRKDLFLFMKVKSFADVFPVMMLWEEKMVFDLYNLFEINITGDNAYLLTKDFEDAIVQNKNARVLYDQEGNIVFMYIYADDTTVVLTKTEELVREVLLRLQKSKVRK